MDVNVILMTFYINFLQIYESILGLGPAGDGQEAMIAQPGFSTLDEHRHHQEKINGGEAMKAQPGSSALDEHLHRQDKRNPKPSDTKQGAHSNRQPSVSNASIIEAQT